MYTAKSSGTRSSTFEFVHHLVASSKKKTATTPPAGGGIGQDQRTSNEKSVNCPQTLLPNNAIDSPPEALQAPTDSPVTTDPQPQPQYGKANRASASGRPPPGGTGMRVTFSDPLRKREEFAKQQRDTKRKEILQQRKKDRQEGIRALFKNPPTFNVKNAGANV